MVSKDCSTIQIKEHGQNFNFKTFHFIVDINIDCENARTYIVIVWSDMPCSVRWLERLCFMYGGQTQIYIPTTKRTFILYENNGI